MLSEIARPLIVVADGHTLNPGDLDWDALARLGEVRVYERSGPLLEERCQAADVVLTNKEIFHAALLARLPKLRFISVLATGTNVVDLAAARSLGVTVSNVPAYATNGVAQHVFALLLELLNQTGAHAAAVTRGEWASSQDFSFTLSPLRELSGKTLGVVGLGRSGQHVAQVAEAFGMRILASRRPGAPMPTLDGAVQSVPFEDLLAQSDIVSLHCPLTDQTRNLINAVSLKQLKPGAYLINTGRGPLLDEVAVLESLKSGHLAGIGLDVLSEEPPAPTHPLIRWAAEHPENARRCIITPHIAWATLEARTRLMNVTVANVRAFLDGHPQNVANP
ncbi:MAG: hypothetical protein RJA70_1657 [Pseudomonadota bacterium]|jgi:glycerate dehydrogenase